MVISRSSSDSPNMNEETRQQISIQAACCVEELLATCEKGAKRIPWQEVVEKRMANLFRNSTIKERPPHVFLNYVKR